MMNSGDYRMMKKRLYAFLIFVSRLLRFTRNKDLGSGAAGMAFFLFLSMIPILTLMSYVLPLCGVAAQTIVEAATELTPNHVDAMVTQLIYEVYQRSDQVLPLSLIFLFWTSANCIVSIIVNLKKVYEIKEPKGYILLHIYAVGYTFFLLVIIAASMFYFLLRVRFISLIAPFLRSLPVIGGFMAYGKFIVVVPFWTLLLILLYNRVSRMNAPGGVLSNLPGALFVCITWFLFTSLFEWYLGKFNNYSTFYGSMASLAVFLIWLYGSSYILLLGGCVNHLLHTAPPVVPAPKSRRREKQDGD